MKQMIAELASEDELTIRHFLSQVVGHTGTPGIAVSIATTGKILDVQVGTLNAQTREELNCSPPVLAGDVTKFITALTALESARHGYVALDAPVSNYVPELKAPPSLTLRALLAQAAGYQSENFGDPDYCLGMDWASFVRTFSERRFLFAPGTVYDQCHSAFVIVAEILARAIQQDIAACWKRFVFDPLNIEPALRKAAPSHARPRPGAPFFAFDEDGFNSFWTPSLGGPSLTTHELAIIGRECVSEHGRFFANREQLFDREIVRVPTMSDGKHMDIPVAMTTGLARFNNGYGTMGNTQGQCLALRIDPRTQASVVVWMNTINPHVRDFILNNLVESFLPEESTARNQLDFGEIDLQAFVGKYLGRTQESVIATYAAGNLTLAITSSSGEMTLRVALDSTGRVICMDSVNIPVGLFYEPTSQSQSLMLGLNAYRRIADESEARC
jgi:CubicO group peptidase (beta-lactamase class C family)